VTVIPGPGVVVIEAVCKAAEPGVTEADVIRWVGVGAAVFGAVLATPEGCYRIGLAFGEELAPQGLGARQALVAAAGTCQRYRSGRDGDHDREGIPASVAGLGCGGTG
jgi:hypothetical protein